MDDEKQKMLKEIMDKRGFVLDFHRVLIEEDLEFLKRYESLVSYATTQKRTLNKKTKELIFVAVLTALQAEKDHIGAHIKLALESGATKKEILEALELIYPPCGTLRFMKGVEAFIETLSKAKESN
jgi:4-carboxymuconolactone decarboxylase